MKNIDTILKNHYFIPSSVARLNLDVPEHQLSLFYHEIAAINQDITLTLHQKSSAVIWLTDADQVVDQSARTLKYYVTLQQSAEVKFLLGLLTSSQITIEIYLYLQGDYAQAVILGAFVIDGHQEIIINTHQMHQARNTMSKVLLRGILSDHSKANIQGLIFIDKMASKTDASQENKNIVCGEQARVISIPSIEVLQHDVQCCHGAAVGKFDDKQLWYLQSRGMSKQESYQLMVFSFLGGVVADFKNPQEFMEKACQKII